MFIKYEKIQKKWEIYMEEKEDIFDKIMKLPFLRKFYKIYKEKKEVLLYLFFGGLTFVISVVTYAYFNQIVKMPVLIANIVSWVIAVLFAFLTNRIWVFQSATKTIAAFFRQMISFFAGRIVTLLVEECILAIFVDQLHFASVWMKIIAQIVVIILNYVISKLFVFKKQEKVAS